jgi:hypothetical protein
METPRPAISRRHLFRQELIADRVEKIGSRSLVAKFEFEDSLLLGAGRSESNLGFLLIRSHDS